MLDVLTVFILGKRWLTAWIPRGDAIWWVSWHRKPATHEVEEEDLVLLDTVLEEDLNRLEARATGR
jgi:hypothetical protein